MKRICFTMAIACLAMSANARAEMWGRVVPFSVYNQSAPKTSVNHVSTGGPAVQAPQQALVQADGYPFEDRCGCNTSSCCSNVWDGYTQPGCGGLGRGLFGHGHHGCGKCGLHGKHLLGGLHGGCATGCCGASGMGGCINSFAGGGCCGGVGLGHGLGWHHGKLHGFGGGCGCGHHAFGALRQLCGFGCDTGCGVTDSGCSTNGNGAVQGPASKQMMAPPTPSIEPTPAEQLPPASEPTEKASTPTEKSAFRLNGLFPRVGF